jgi:hypothetical protein
MKKVSLFLGMVLIASFAMAQNVATTNQDGNSNGATVDQVGSNLTGLVDQINGNSNTGIVIQKGTNNDAGIVQGMVEGYWAPDYLTPDMTANSNYAKIEQLGAITGSSAQVLQVGDGNNGRIKQDAQTGSVAEIYQGWPGGAWSSYTVVGTSNIATIDQVTGQNNTGLIWSLGTGNTINLDQLNGNNNEARLSQGYNYDGIIGVPKVMPVTGNTQNVAQSGDNNLVRNFQLGNTNTFNLNQYNGVNTVGGRTDRNLTLPGGRNARAEYFQQLGNGNTFVGTQNGYATLSAASIQHGDYNEIYLTQGLNDDAVIIQEGNYNKATATQMGGNQDASIYQNGIGNTSSVSQSGL